MALSVSRGVTAVMAGFVVLSVVISGVLISRISGEGAVTGLVSGLVTAAALGALLVVGVLVGLAVERSRASRIRKIRREMGPLLASWVGLPSGTAPADDICSEWSRAVKAGVTPRVAQRWSDAGFPFTMIRGAQRIGLQLSDVIELRRVFEAGGIEFADRWDLDGMVVGMEMDGVKYGLRWDLFMRDEIDQQVRVSIGDSQFGVRNGAVVLWEAYQELAERRFGEGWFQQIRLMPVGSSGADRSS